MKSPCRMEEDEKVGRDEEKNKHAWQKKPKAKQW